MKKVILIVLLQVAFLAGVTWAQDLGQTGADFLKIEVGARQAGMAGAFVGVADDVNSVFWNPAGLGNLKTWGFSGLHSEWLGDMRYDYLGAAFKPFGKNYAVGLSAAMLYIPLWDNTEGKEEEVSASDMVAILSLARRLPKGFSVGTNFKYISRKLADYSSTAYAGDIGATYRLSFQIGSWPNWLTLGANAQNLGTDIKFINESHPLPRTLKGGASLRLGYGKSHDILLTSEVDYPVYDEIITAKIGMEYWIKQLLALRGGYKFNQDASDFALGFGIRYGMLHLDYAFNPFKNSIGSLEHPLSSHQISLFIRSVAPLPFDIFSPGLPKKKLLKKDKAINLIEQKTVTYVDGFDLTLFRWEPSADPDPGDNLTYEILYAKIEDPEGDNLKEIVKNFQKKNKSIHWKQGWTKREAKGDTLKYQVTSEDNVKLSEGIYLVKIKAVDRKGHGRDSKGEFHVIDIRNRISPRLESPSDKKIIDVISQIGQSRLYPPQNGDFGEKILFASADPQGLHSSLTYRSLTEVFAPQGEEKEPRASVTFRWSPGQLELSLSESSVLIYKDSTETVLCDSCYVATNDSLTYNKFPIPYGDCTYYWKVRSWSGETVKDAPLWKFTLRAEIMEGAPGITGPEEVVGPTPWPDLMTEFPDTLRVKTVTTIIADRPMLPVFFFQPNSTVLDKDSEEALSTFIKTLRKKSIDNEGVVFIVKGYVDSWSETSDARDAFGLALNRAAYIRERLISDDKELVSRVVIDTLRAPEFWESRNREIEITKTYRWRDQLLAENQRVEIEVIVRGANPIEYVFDEGELVNDLQKIRQLERILERNKDVIVILESGSEQNLLNSRLALRKLLRERYHPALFVYKVPGGNSRVTMSITADRLIYRPLPPERRPSELNRSWCSTEIGISSPIPFDWKLKLIDYESKEELITLSAGQCKTGFGNWHKKVSWKSEKVEFRRGIYEKYAFKLKATGDLGRDFTFYRPVVVEVTEEEIVKEIKIIIQHTFDTIYPDSRFLETQVEQFARDLVKKGPKYFTVQISGHTCHIGNYERNKELSLSRAASVRNSLLTHLRLLEREAKTEIQRRRARQWREKIETMTTSEIWNTYDSCFGCAFRFPYKGNLRLPPNLWEEEVRSEVTKYNESPIMRAMNRRTQANVTEVRRK